MSLGGGAGFGAGYTPIRFAPLVSLTGPLMAPATPAAPEAAAPMLRLPMMADQGGGYETPQRTDAAFQNLQPIGTRMEQKAVGPEFRDLSRAMTDFHDVATDDNRFSLAQPARPQWNTLMGGDGNGWWAGGAGNASRAVWRVFAGVAEFARQFCAQRFWPGRSAAV
jgi:hypothetical protein